MLGRLLAYLFGAGFLAAGVGALAGAASAVRTNGVTANTASLGLVGLLFALVGVGVIAMVRASARSDARRTSGDDENGRAPWRVEGPWRGFAVPSGSGGELVATWAAGAFASLFVSPFVLAVMPAKTTKPAGRVVIALLALGALAIVVRALVLTFRHLRHGGATLHLARLPLVPGGAFEAVLTAPGELAPGVKWKARLAVNEATTTRHGNGTHRTTRVHTTTLAETQLEVEPREGGGRTVVGLTGTLPVAPPRDEQGNPTITWELTIEARQEGADFVQSFDLPVYEAPEELVERRSEPWPA